MKGTDRTKVYRYSLIVILGIFFILSIMFAIKKRNAG